jgi:hypothetical protein
MGKRFFRAKNHVIRITVMSFILTLFFTVSGVYGVYGEDIIAEKTHIVIFPESRNQIFVLDVTSFPENLTFKGDIIFELPEDSLINNISGNLYFEKAELKGNKLILRNASVEGKEHIALSYFSSILDDGLFRKNITFRTEVLTVLIPKTVSTEKFSENLELKGTRILGGGEYTIFQSKNITGEIYLYLKPAANTGTGIQKNVEGISHRGNDVLLYAGIVLIVSGLIIFVLSKEKSGWRLDEGEIDEDKTSITEPEKNKENGGWEI